MRHREVQHFHLFVYKLSSQVNLLLKTYTFKLQKTILYERVVTCCFASGNRYQTNGAFGNTGAYAYYWSCSPTGNNIHTLVFTSSLVHLLSNPSRAISATVRCVQYLLNLLWNSLVNAGLFYTLYVAQHPLLF